MKRLLQQQYMLKCTIFRNIVHLAKDDIKKTEATLKTLTEK